MDPGKALLARVHMAAVHQKGVARAVAADDAEFLLLGSRGSRFGSRFSSKSLSVDS